MVFDRIAQEKQMSITTLFVCFLAMLGLKQLALSKENVWKQETGVVKISFAKVKYIGRLFFHNAECRGVDEDSCLLLLASNFSKEPNTI